MKALIITLLLAIPGTMWSQDKNQEKAEQLSEAEKVSGRAGSLVEVQFIDIGKVKGVEIELMTVKNLSDKTEVRAVKVSYTEPKQYATQKSSVLDKDELDGLIASLRTLKGLFAETRDTYTEVTYKSRTSFKAGAYFDTKDSKWQGFVEVGRIGSATAFLSADDMGKVLELMESVKGRM